MPTQVKPLNCNNIFNKMIFFCFRPLILTSPVWLRIPTRPLFERKIRSIHTSGFKGWTVSFIILLFFLIHWSVFSAGFRCSRLSLIVSYYIRVQRLDCKFHHFDLILKLLLANRKIHRKNCKNYWLGHTLILIFNGFEIGNWSPSNKFCFQYCNIQKSNFFLKERK